MYLSHFQPLATHANRGNVAIIVWNTLEAPYVWDVTNTEYEGAINLGNSTRSLLSIYFRDYVYDYETLAGTTTYLKELEYVTVSQVPATDSELGENQVALRADAKYTEEAVWNDILATKLNRGTDEKEATYGREVEKVEEIVAYAPEMDNLDSLFGKVITVIFGKDNEVVSIRIVDETVEDEYLTAWEDNKLEIGNAKYKFASKAEIFMNTVPVEDMDKVFEILKIKDPTDFNKTIKANVVLNNSGKVTRLDLFVSGTYTDIYTKEAVVSKVRNEVITLNNKEEIDFSEDGRYEDEDDQPRVIKDGTIIGLNKIEVGDVLTYYYKSATDDTIKTIYVCSTRKEGELTRASKTDLKLTVDGETFYSSMEKLYVTDDKIDDAEEEKDANAYIGENVELYLNIYGEYVLMASEKAAQNWVFGIVTTVRDTEDDEEDDDIYRIPVRILLADGTTSRAYKFLFDDEEDDGDVKSWETKIGALENEFIVFAPDANKEISVDDYEVVKLNNSKTTIASGDYEVIFVEKGNKEIDDDRERIKSKIFSSDTVIFNIGYNTTEKSFDPETSKSWKMLVENDKLAQDSLLILEEDSKTLSYVLINVSEDEYAISDAEYAIVETEDYKEKRGSSIGKYTELLTVNGVEEFEGKKADEPYTVNLEDWFIEYTLSGSKLSSVSKLIDLPAFKKLKVDEKVTDEVRDGKETKLVVSLADHAKDCTYVAEEKCTLEAHDPATCKDPAHGYKEEGYTENASGTYTVVKSVTDENTEVSVKDAGIDVSKNAYYTDIYVKLVPVAKCTQGHDANTCTDADHGYIPKHHVICGSSDPDALKVGTDIKLNEVITLPKGEVPAVGEYVKLVAVTKCTKGHDANSCTEAEHGYVAKHYEVVESGTTGALKVVKTVSDSSKEIEFATVTGDLDGYKCAEVKVNKTSASPCTEPAHDPATCKITTDPHTYVAPVACNCSAVTATKANFRVVDTQKLLLEYEDDKDEVNFTLGEVILDEDVVVYDARDGKLKEVTFSALRDEVAKDGYVYVIPFANEDAYNYGKTNVEANILVIVD